VGETLAKTRFRGILKRERLNTGELFPSRGEAGGSEEKPQAGEDKGQLSKREGAQPTPALGKTATRTGEELGVGAIYIGRENGQLIFRKGESC